MAYQPTQHDVEQYKEAAAEILRRESVNAENFDKAILTLSSGVLALSLTFLKDIVSLKTAVYDWLLYTSWAAFTFAIAATILSYLFAPFSTRWQLARIERLFLAGQKSAADEKSIFDTVIGRCYQLAGLAFLGGIITMSLFIGINTRNVKMTEKEHVRKSQPPVPVRRVPEPSPAPKAPAKAPNEPAKKP